MKKCVETGVNVYDNCKKLAEWNGIHIEKSQTKPVLTHKLKKMKLKWSKEKQTWCVDNWMKVIFSNESRICIGQGNDVGTLVSY